GRSSRLLADAVPGEGLEPVEGIDDDRLVLVRLGTQLGQGREHLGVAGREREPVTGDLVQAVLGLDKDGAGGLGREGRFADALSAVDEHAGRPGSASALDALEQTHGATSWVCAGRSAVTRSTRKAPAPNSRRTKLTNTRLRSRPTAVVASIPQARRPASRQCAASRRTWDSPCRPSTANSASSSDASMSSGGTSARKV